MREMPVKKAGEILGETDQKLWRALFAHVDAAWMDLSWENVVWVGADEKNRKKGHHYLTVFVDLQAKRVLLAVEGKDAGTWERFAEQLGKHNGHPKAIRQVDARCAGKLRQRGDRVRQISRDQPSQPSRGRGAPQGGAAG